MRFTPRHLSAALLIAVLGLSGCGNDPVGNDYSSFARVIMEKLLSGKAGIRTLESLDAQGIAALRKALEDDGQAITLVVNPFLKYSALMAPYGQNGDVRTWASMNYESVALRDGMLVATRGFGADLMSVSGPSVAAIAAGSGTTSRRHHYLDGADRPQRYDFSCQVNEAGAETVIILGKPYATRKVVEVCTGALATFTNEYWFDRGTNLRQSRQMIVPGLPNLLLQRVID